MLEADGLAMYQICFDLSSPETFERETRSLQESELVGATSAYIITYNQENMLQFKSLKINILLVWK
jgi:hypothetical protein